MKKEYNVRYGMSWDIRTSGEVIATLATAQQNNQRLHISFGHTDNDEGKLGRDWLEEFMSYGYIGRSTGINKIPLLIHNTRSHGGPALLDHCIVRIRASSGGRVLYQHPQYHHGKITIRRKWIPVQYPGGTLTVDVFRDSEHIASFRDMASARRYIGKLGVQAEIVNNVELALA